MEIERNPFARRGSCKVKGSTLRRYFGRGAAEDYPIGEDYGIEWPLFRLGPIAIVFNKPKQFPLPRFEKEE